MNSKTSLTDRQKRVLAALDHGAQNADELAERARLPRGAVELVVAALVKCDLVAGGGPETDSYYLLTASGDDARQTGFAAGPRAPADVERELEQCRQAEERIRDERERERVDRLRTLRRATRRKRETTQAWRQAIRAAREAGATFTEIGKSAGVSDVRVLQIAHEEAGRAAEEKAA